MRMLQVWRLFPSFQLLINSPWSNIRSLVYGILCYWVRSDLVNNKNHPLLSSLLPIRSSFLFPPPSSKKCFPPSPSLQPASLSCLPPSPPYSSLLPFLKITFIFSSRITTTPPSTQLSTLSSSPPSTPSSPVQKQKTGLADSIFWAHFVDLASILLQKDCWLA